jgi:PAS domain S-box-containing protein
MEDIAMLQAILDSAQDAIIIANQDLLITHFNPAAERMFGYRQEEMVNKVVACADFVPLRMQEEMARGIVHYKATGEGPMIGSLVETVGRRRNGEEFAVEMSLSKFNHGDQEGIVAVIRDISERKKWIDELAEADRRKDEFLAVLSHELRNPLAPILSSLQVSRMRDGNQDAVLRDHRNIIERQVKHMGRLLDDLLDMARISRGKINIKQEPVQLQRAISNAIDQSRPAIDTRYHSLYISIPSEAIWMVGDAPRVEQAISNLLNNAAKYTEPGGKIRLNCLLSDDQKKVKIEVVDTGIGISETMLPRIFDLFVQAERRGEYQTHGGLGVGLSLVKQLTELQGGTVAAHSPGLNLGSTFSIEFPVSDVGDEVPVPESIEGGSPRKEDTGEPASFPIAPTKDCRILVVDDNVDAADSMVAMLRMQGYDVWVANDGPAALKSATEFVPNIVLLDIGLPYMDGYKVCQELIRLVPETKVIAVTGFGQEKDRQRAQDAGFHDFLVKPLDLATINQMMHKYDPTCGK